MKGGDLPFFHADGDKESAEQKEYSVCECTMGD
jgi:hypothetical protein